MDAPALQDHGQGRSAASMFARLANQRHAFYRSPTVFPTDFGDRNAASGAAITAHQPHRGDGDADRPHPPTTRDQAMTRIRITNRRITNPVLPMITTSPPLNDSSDFASASREAK